MNTECVAVLTLKFESVSLLFSLKYFTAMEFTRQGCFTRITNEITFGLDFKKDLKSLMI
jgi:hypothetical protein